MNRFHLIYLSIILILASCISSNILTYKNKHHYSEENVIMIDSSFKLIQSVCYNKPDIIDEEFCHNLKLTFLDTAMAKAKQTLDLEVDTNIVKAEYGIFSIWNWENENNQVSGQIEITYLDTNQAILTEDIIVTDHRRTETKVFKGTRTFTRSEG